VLGKKVEDWLPEWREFTLGLSFGNITARPTIGIQVATAEGPLRILKVVEGSGADKAGVRATDVVSGADGQKVATMDDLQQILRNKKRGDTIVLNVTRSDAAIELNVTLQ